MGYGKTSAVAIQSDQDRLSGSRYFKVPSQGVMVYLCPPWAEDQTRPYYEVLVHYNVSDSAVMCRKQIGEICPICVENQELYNRKDDDAAQALSKEIYAKRMYFYNVVPNVSVTNQNGKLWLVSGSKVDMVVKPYFVGIKLHKQFANFYNFNGDIYDPKACNPIQLQKDAGGKDLKFASTIAMAYPQKCELHPDLLKLLDNMPDLSKEITPLSFEDTKNLIDLKLASYKALRGGGTMIATVSAFPKDPIPNATITVPGRMPTVTTSPMVQPGTQTVASMPPPPAVITSSEEAEDALPASTEGNISDLDAFEKQLREGNTPF